MSPRRIPWFGLYIALCVTIIAAHIFYGVWANRDIHQKMAALQASNVVVESAIRLKCDDNHIWGHLVIFNRASDGLRVARPVCRDWAAGKWILYAY
jgi:hypothetical protein